MLKIYRIKADKSENQSHHWLESSYEGVIESKEVQVLRHWAQHSSVENMEKQEEDLIVWNYLHEVCAVGVPYDQMNQKSDIRWRSNQEKKDWNKREKKEKEMKKKCKWWWWWIGKGEKEVHVFIKVANIHFNLPGKLAFKSNSFSCNLVQNYNLVRKLIPN